MWRPGTFRLFPSEPDMWHRASVVVLLLGWLGCGARQLQKYCDLWTSLGDFSVLALRPTVPQIASPFLADRLGRETLSRLMRLRQESQQSRKTCLVHCMSNAGFLTFGNVMRWAEFEEKKKRLRMEDGEGRVLNDVLVDDDGGMVRGMVLDSAPSKATADVWARGTLSALLRKPVSDVARDQGALLRLGRAVAGTYLSVSRHRKHLDEIYDVWRRRSPAVPQLYLYSSSDSLIPVEDVELFAMEQIKRGISVTLHRWEDSEHCEHYRQHPEEYRETLKRFVDSLSKTNY